MGAARGAGNEKPENNEERRCAAVCRIRHFIWDFDGMLFDTYPHTLAAFLETCRRLGIAADKNEAYALMRINLRRAFAHYGFTPEDTAAFYALENDLSLLPRGVPYPRIPELLAFIKARGGENHLYTHRDSVAVEYLRLYGLQNLFSALITGEDGFPFKPAPDALNHLIAQRGLIKAECLMLGDRDIDVGAAVNAGIPALLFDTEGRYRTNVGETYRCESTEELERTVTKLIY